MAPQLSHLTFSFALPGLWLLPGPLAPLLTCMYMVDWVPVFKGNFCACTHKLHRPHVFLVRFSTFTLPWASELVPIAAVLASKTDVHSATWYWLVFLGLFLSAAGLIDSLPLSPVSYSFQYLGSASYPAQIITHSSADAFPVPFHWFLYVRPGIYFPGLLKFCLIRSPLPGVYTPTTIVH